MKLLHVCIFSILGFSLVSGLQNTTADATRPDAELMKQIAADFDQYFKLESKTPELQQLTPQKRKQGLMFVLLASLLKHRHSLEKTAEENHFSTKELQKYLKKSLLSSPEMNKLERNLAQVVADKRDVSPRFFGKIKQWFVSKAVKMVGSLMSLPPAPTDEDFEDDDYFSAKPTTSVG